MIFPTAQWLYDPDQKLCKYFAMFYFLIFEITKYFPFIRAGSFIYLHLYIYFFSFSNIKRKHIKRKLHTHTHTHTLHAVYYIIDGIYVTRDVLRMELDWDYNDDERREIFSTNLKLRQKKKCLNAILIELQQFWIQSYQNSLDKSISFWH